MSRTVAFVCCALFSTHAAAAAETWNCTFVDKMGALPLDAHIEATIRIEDHWLHWLIETPVIGQGGRPVPDLKGGYQHRTVDFRYQILENNDVGIVASSSEAKTDNQIGPLLGAEIITLSKPSGSLRVGSVMANGEHDLMVGNCQKE